MNKEELELMCKERGLPSGMKAEMVEHLVKQGY